MPSSVDGQKGPRAMTLTYDLHMHSCLSPCGHEDMTPSAMAGMAFLAGLDVVALADHNTIKNVRAFAHLAESYGLLPIPALELTTSEEAHILCLFPTLEGAEDFFDRMWADFPKVPNRPDFFGEQLIVDEEDRITGREEHLLLMASTLSTYEIAELLRGYGGLAIPAHIDRTSDSVPANLGFVSAAMGFEACELTSRADPGQLALQNEGLAGKPYLINSDAHYLTDIPDGQFTLEAHERSAAEVIQAIRRGKGLPRLLSPGEKP